MCFAWLCSAWDKLDPRSWRSAANVMGALRLQNAPHACGINGCCSDFLSGDFLQTKVVELRTSVDLERSFGPIYARGLLTQGQSSFAVLGVNAEETQASIDASLTFGILWLDLCRQSQAGKTVVEGLKLFLPAEKSCLTRERMARLHREAGK